MRNWSKKFTKKEWYRLGFKLGYEPFESMDYAHYRRDLGVNYWDYMGRLGKSIVLQVKKDGGNRVVYNKYVDGETKFVDGGMYNIVTKNENLLEEVIYEASDRSFYTPAYKTGMMNVRICHESHVDLYTICVED